MNGFYTKETSSRLLCGKYECKMKSGMKNPEGATLAAFSEIDVQRFKSPPPKKFGDLWGFFSKASQNHISRRAIQSAWNGMFNYSVTFNRDDEANYHVFRARLKRKPFPTTIHFYPKPRMKELRALWFVSHCTDKERAGRIYSGREKYVLESSRHIHIDIFSSPGSTTCRSTLGTLVKDANMAEPPFEDYMFYLSFENNNCQDCITEKLWKVLESNSTTIPVALGGVSIKDYELVAPPNSFIHVKNFSSPAALVKHLRYVAENDDAFHYYNQWRNEFDLVSYHLGNHGELRTVKVIRSSSITSRMSGTLYWPLIRYRLGRLDVKII
ncbi:4-galactosyl-N-acetylglucosaminide 3-alpha-L-fucosyltransferase 9-like [Watersipora subatra]|uniref:4-galactosyl-N-acetylglucosaminide 3-alpha-L-fucosyltransferase 9-like n=1 Tax=Watersipora subatra TaxID=2589382 RepID=UPI00355B46E4